MVYRSPVQYIRFQGPSYPPGTWGSRDRGEGTHTGRHLGRHLGRHTRVDEPHNQTDSPTHARARARTTTRRHHPAPDTREATLAIGSARATATFLPLLWFRSASQACSDASLLTQLFTGTIQDIGQLDGRKNERHASPPDRNTHGLSCARVLLTCAPRLYVIGPLTLQCIFCGVSRPCTIHLRYTRIHSGYRILRDTVAGCIKIHQDTPSRRNSTTSFTRKPHRSRINACTPTTRPSSK